MSRSNDNEFEVTINAKINCSDSKRAITHTYHLINLIMSDHSFLTQTDKEFIKQNNITIKVVSTKNITKFSSKD